MNEFKPEDVVKAAPELLFLLCQGQHKVQREYLYHRILYGTMQNLDGSTVLSKEKIAELKEEGSAHFSKLPRRIQDGIAKAVSKEFAPVFYFVASQQLANVRLAKLLGLIKEKVKGGELAKLIAEHEKEWGENV